MYKQKDLAFYKSLVYSVVVDPQHYNNERYYIAYAKELGKKSCYGEGDTPQEALNSFYMEKDAFIEELFSMRKPIPEPASEEGDNLPNGVINVRTSPTIHAKLLEQSRKANVSLNLYLNQILSSASALIDVKEEVSSKLEEVESVLNYNFSRMRRSMVNYHVEPTFEGFWIDNNLKDNMIQVLGDVEFTVKPYAKAMGWIVGGEMHQGVGSLLGKEEEDEKVPAAGI